MQEQEEAQAELLEQFDSLEDAERDLGTAYQSAARTFEEAHRLVNQVKKARGYFPIVGIGTYDDGFNSLPGNRTQAARGPSTSRGGSRKGGTPRGSGGGKAPRPLQQPAAKLRKGGTPGQATREAPPTVLGREAPTKLRPLLLVRARWTYRARLSEQGGRRLWRTTKTGIRSGEPGRSIRADETLMKRTSHIWPGTWTVNIKPIQNGRWGRTGPC